MSKAFSSASKAPQPAAMLHALATRGSLALAAFTQQLQERASTHAGYPYNLSFSYQDLAPLLRLHLNNLGDPYRGSNYGIHSREYEQRCISWLASLYDAGPDHWGYVTACGTEGNLYGILLGRERFPDGVLYFSRDTHYSVMKAARMFRMPYVVIDSHADGSINLGHFESQIERRRKKPAIIVCNIGTTLKAAVDDLASLICILNRAGMQRFIHCDGALGGLLLPFMHGAPRYSLKNQIDSVAVSGHKFLGAPFPCGMVLTKRTNVAIFEQMVEYIGHDSTIMGSRNGLAPIILWQSIAGDDRDFCSEVSACRVNAEYLFDNLRRIDDTTFLGRYSTTVTMRAPKRTDIVRRWQLPVDNGLTHCVVMQNITRPVIDKFVAEWAGVWEL
jgi:histidine decarboxylase